MERTVPILKRILHYISSYPLCKTKEEYWQQLLHVMWDDRLLYELNRNLQREETIPKEQYVWGCGREQVYVALFLYLRGENAPRNNMIIRKSRHMSEHHPFYLTIPPALFLCILNSGPSLLCICTMVLLIIEPISFSLFPQTADFLFSSVCSCFFFTRKYRDMQVFHGAQSDTGHPHKFTRTWKKVLA